MAEAVAKRPRSLAFNAFPIATNTFRETVRQPVYWIIIFLSIGLMWITSRLPLWTIGGLAADEMMAKDIGLATVTVCGLLIALFASSSAVADELENKTALTVLSKPVSRGQFIVGKFLGIASAVFVACLITGTMLVIILCTNVIGPREGEYIDHPDVNVRHELKQRILRDQVVAVKTIAQGTFLSFLQVMFIAAISVAISTRVPVLVNIVICFVLFIVGRMAIWLKSLIMNYDDFLSQAGTAAETGKHAVTQVLSFIWTVAYAILPNMDNANAQMTLASGKILHSSYLLLVTANTVLYVIGVMLFATVLLRRREIS